MPSGEVSVIPQACTTRMPCRSSNPRISAGGQAEPPITTIRSEEVSYGVSRSVGVSSSSSRPFQMVGTAALTVGRTWSIIAASGRAWRKRSGISRLAPDMKAAYGTPQAQTWNIGTTGSAVSCEVRPKVAAEFTWRQCR